MFPKVLLPLVVNDGALWKRITYPLYFYCNGLTHYQTTNFRLFQTERVCRRQFQIWRKSKKKKVIQAGRKHCGKSRNCFSFSHSVFKRLVSQRCQKESLCGNGLMNSLFMDHILTFKIQWIWRGNWLKNITGSEREVNIVGKGGKSCIKINFSFSENVFGGLPLFYPLEIKLRSGTEWIHINFNYTTKLKHQSY